jgi:hypothetical protein
LDAPKDLLADAILNNIVHIVPSRPDAMQQDMGRQDMLPDIGVNAAH